MVCAIIVAAGSSRRMGFDKLSARIAGVTVLERSIRAFQSSDAIDRIVVVTAEERFAEVIGLRASKVISVVPGGAERHLSVHRGLLSVAEGTEIVAVHDGARPLVTQAAIARCVEAARSGGAASLAHRITDTLKRADAAGRVTGGVSREHLWGMETPQAFRLDLLLRAYETVLDAGAVVTDEVSAVESLGEPVQLVENHEPNPKITVPADLALAAAILAARPGE